MKYCVLILILIGAHLCVSEGKKADASSDASKGGGDRMAGKWSTIDVNDTQVQRVAQVGIALLNENLNSQYGIQLIKISNAKSQVVSGINYRITTHIGHCKNSQMCEFHKTQNCTMILWDQSWLNSTRLTKYECSKAKFAPLFKSPEMMPGGVSEAKKNDPGLLEAAKFAGAKLAEKAGKNYKVTVKKIHDATQQVVAGAKYVMVADVHVKNVKDSSNKLNSKTTCLLDVVLQPWVKPPNGPNTLIAYDCDSQRFNTLFSGVSITPK